MRSGQGTLAGDRARWGQGLHLRLCCYGLGSNREAANHGRSGRDGCFCLSECVFILVVGGEREAISGPRWSCL